ncbi:TPA: S8 family peptidase [Vibrio cholerae]|nr:S8 family peptidase [Vibrio cholerae]EGR2064012.1 S8 family peptidase [Vibrio cholerae]EGR2114685.1 S8 family peptidase [Vibrio cholerae]EGR2244123.1 S8 family peptidase [Vibrio cholerae]
MEKRLPILSKAEVYSDPAPKKKSKPNPKIMPYKYSEAKGRIYHQLEDTIKHFEDLPSFASPGDNIVSKITLHPSFLAKSYFPKKLLAQYDFKNLGSRETIIEPKKAATEKQKGVPLSTSMYFISGTKGNYQKLISDIQNDNLGDDCESDLIKLEEISFFDAEDKVTEDALFQNSHEQAYEVVLHASQENPEVISSFNTYIEKLGGTVFHQHTRTIKGLTFCFVSINTKLVTELAKFVYVRVVRIVPELRLSDRVKDIQKPLVSRHTERLYDSSVSHSNVAIFDAGLFEEDLNREEIRYFDLTDLEGEDDPDNLLHGSLVTSAFVFGDAEELVSSSAFLNVDHYKVYSQNDESSIGLVKVLDRIESVLRTKKYKFANISLGPEIPCPDNEPSLWSSTLDDIASSGDILIFVAVGNQGGLINTKFGKAYARVQPPADMINGMAVGSANSKGKNWQKASYSCVGPGRRPGYVKPDILCFGGDTSEKLKLVSLSDFSIKPVMGTSYSTALMTRLAAKIDILTNHQLNVATIRALILHNADLGKRDKVECGWGGVFVDAEDIVFCSPNKVTLIYQGRLENATGIRAAVPCPSTLQDKASKLSLDATMCFYTDVDQQHTSSYTKAGIEVTFRPDRHNVKEGASQAHTRSLFTKKKILGDEQSLREDAHKWETCFKVHDSIMTKGISMPTLDIRYLTREEGQPISLKDLKPMNFSLVITLSVKESACNLYQDILNEYDLLVPLELATDAIVKAGEV